MEASRVENENSEAKTCAALLTRRNGVIEEPVTESEARVSCFRGGHRFRVSIFASHLSGSGTESSSGKFVVGGHDFELLLFQKKDGEDYLSFYVRFIGPQEFVRASWSLRCVNQRNASESIEKGWDKGDNRNEFVSGRHWGWSKFAKKSKVMDPKRGFILNETLLFEATIVVLGKTRVHSIPSLNTSDSLGVDLGNLLSSGETADVVFALDQGATLLLGHKSILAARSKVLGSMLSGRFRESAVLKPSGAIGDTYSSSSSSASSSSIIRRDEPTSSGSTEMPRELVESGLGQIGAVVATRSEDQVTQMKHYCRVEITDISGSVFKEVLYYLYTGQMNPKLAQFALHMHKPTHRSSRQQKKRRVPKARPFERRSESSVRSLGSSGAESFSEDESFEELSDHEHVQSQSRRGTKRRRTTEQPHSSSGDEKSPENTSMYLTLMVDLLIAADKYNLMPLRTMCEKYLILCLHEKNVVYLLNIADMCSVDQLKQECFNFINSSRSSLMDEQLETLRKELLMELLRFNLNLRYSDHRPYS